MMLADAVIVIWAVVGAHLIRFGLEDHNLPGGTPYILITVFLPVAWWIMLHAWGSREPRIMGSGPDEFKRVLAASLWLFGALAIVSYAFQMDLARGYVGIAFPIGAIGLMAGRWILRQHLAVARAKGEHTFSLLLVGGPQAVGHLAESLRRSPQAGYTPIGAYLQGSMDRVLDGVPDLPIFGGDPTAAGILDVVRNCGADAVAITAGIHLPPKTIRQLGWDLAAANIGMIVAPALTDIAGPRIHTQQVAGLPLIHVTTPKLEGGKRVAKRAFDLFGAGLLIIFLSPLFAVLAVLTKLSNPGPVFYTQERVGVRGRTFNMIKFRSMIVNADAQLAALLDAQGTADKPLFKIENDPRITPIGGFLRKYSLDELPQLFNVVLGNMSLVGPRPQRDGEVALYDDAAKRRLYVQPGMSGLWQVSGRSNLTWEESIRLDLYYVENWSLITDIAILFKTAKAVVASQGAV
ncbi:polyprenyl glycosylphosphotransferase [Arthrobacter alpinus]|uniref:sugar transferase n=1 Tax=Arthrobacter alpinus TaxID=656366 RepID=UPI0005C8FE4F|nr:sugar transferase [Arthrobacter alpinus]ALV44565.1 polyprenyl glycosylphosphotransferase [Arthrobacter alpinus]